MSVYVDSIQSVLLSKNWKYPRGCHLVADAWVEVHSFEASIGLKSIWFQDKSMPHYDLTPNKRRLAIQIGAIDVDRKQFVELLRKRRRLE